MGSFPELLWECRRGGCGMLAIYIHGTLSWLCIVYFPGNLLMGQEAKENHFSQCRRPKSTYKPNGHPGNRETYGRGDIVERISEETV